MEGYEKDLKNKSLEETLYIESIPGFEEELIRRGNAGVADFIDEEEVDF